MCQHLPDHGRSRATTTGTSVNPAVAWQQADFLSRTYCKGYILVETFSPLDDVLAPMIARESCLKELSAWPFPQVRDAWAVKGAGD